MADERDTGRASPTARTVASTAVDTPEQIGPYKILERIGEGGMGVVYLAEQTEPVRRRVALKIIKVGMDTKAVVARFEAERQALAVMDHPCVAKVLDAGVTEYSPSGSAGGGRPYFVMEHIAGVPITDHCDRQRLNITDRLKLFMLVCEAVQHAHQKGIIHRDLKPSNILVSAKDSGGVPKVIDFGVAKALHQKLTEQTLFTEQGQLIGTPEYMSPEQAEMTAQDIDTRSDVYSLGVLLYELLTGERPLSSETLRRAGLAEIQRIIREDDPPKPSTRSSSLGDESAAHARSCRADPRALTRSLKGDLDWIVMKAIEKDRARRYETANGLAADLRRHLAHEPVQAGPPGVRYRLGKFVRRHRVGVTAAAVVLFVMLVGIAGTTWGLVSAITARDAEAAAKSEAQERADELEQVAEFQASQLSDIDVPLMAVHLRDDLLREARSALERPGLDEEEVAERAQRFEELLAGANLTNVALATLDRNIFERALKAVDEQFADQPLVRARLLQTLADTLREVGLIDAARAPQTEALEVRRRVLGDEHPDTLESIIGMGYLLQDRGKLDEAEPHLRAALEGRRRMLGNDHPDTLSSINSMGILLQDQGRLEEAEPYFREALAGDRRELGDEHPDTLVLMGNMGILLEDRGKLDEAESYFRSALEGARRVLGDDDPQTPIAMNNLGSVLLDRGKLDEAEPYYVEALAIRRRVLGDEHPATLESMNNLGGLLQAQGRRKEAEQYYREALEHLRRVLGNDHQDTLASINNMGSVLRAQGKLMEAEPYYREALEGLRRELGDEHPTTLGSMHNLGNLERELGHTAEAEALGAEAVERARQSLPEGHWFTGVFLGAHGRTLTALERYADAERTLLEAHEILDVSLGARHGRTLRVSASLADLYDAWHTVEPDEHHDAAAAEWRAKLE